jgi:hypothetical protein
MANDKNPESIREFGIPLLPCRSVNETLEFYKAIGSTITYQQKAPNNYIGLKIKSIEVHFFGLKQLAPEANFSTCYLIVDDIDTLYANCRAGLKGLYGKLPLKGIPRINTLKDMPTYGVRQFVIVDPSGNYIRIGQPIAKKQSLLFEENGKKPEKGTALSKAYELADRLANGKEDLEAATAAIDKALASGDTSEPETLFRLVTLGMDIANRDEDPERIGELAKIGKELLEQVKDRSAIAEDIRLFNELEPEV